MRKVLDSILCIQDVFDAWRQLGAKKLANGTELIGRQGDDDSVWMHAVFPRLSAEQIDQMEGLFGMPLPAELRQFYSVCGGMALFGGVFRLYGLPANRGVISEHPTVDDIVALNHQLDHCEWKSPGAIAIATSEWDASVFLVGMGRSQREVVRVARGDGTVLERTDGLWNLVAEKLYRLDAMLSANVDGLAAS